MKRSFYEMLGVRADADQAEIERAYSSIVARLASITSLRGTPETQLIHEGYRILSDAARRAEYDAKVLSRSSSARRPFVADEERAHRNLNLLISGFALMLAIVAGIAWSHVNQRIHQVRLEHQQALAKQKGARPAQIAVQTQEPSEPSAQFQLK